MKKKAFLSILACSLLLQGCSFTSPVGTVHVEFDSSETTDDFQFIDSDGNGYLSFDEVYSLSIDSLSRSINKPHSNQDDNEVVKTLADYFAKLIFQLVEMPIDKEIPIEMIKQKICEGGKAASYLEMFICADNFT